MTSTRRIKVHRYIKEWHSGFWAFGATGRDDVAERIASNVVVYFGLGDGSLGAYVTAVQGMLDSGDLELKAFESGELYLEF